VSRDEHADAQSETRQSDDAARQSLHGAVGEQTRPTSEMPGNATSASEFIISVGDSTAEIDAVSEADWPDGLERLHLDEKQIALQIPVEHPWSRMDAVPIEMLKDQKIAVINRALGAPLSVALSRPLREAGAELVRPPEGHPIAVERYGRLTRIPAVSLGWFDAPVDAPPKDVVIRQIKGLNLSTTLSLIRIHGEHRPSAALVWEMAKRPRTKRKPERRRASSERKRPSESPRT